MESALLIKKIFSYLEKKNETLSTAESCTGGMIAHHLTNYPGSSRFFVGSIVSYSTDVKVRLLKVSQSIVKNKTVVSQEAAESMAKGVKSLLQSDWSVSITGFMSSSKNDSISEVGRLFVSVCGPQFIKTQETWIPHQDRENMKKAAAVFSLNFLLLNFCS